MSYPKMIFRDECEFGKYYWNDYYHKNVLKCVDARTINLKPSDRKYYDLLYPNHKAFIDVDNNNQLYLSKNRQLMEVNKDNII